MSPPKSLSQQNFVQFSYEEALPCHVNMVLNFFPQIWKLGKNLLTWW